MCQANNPQYFDPQGNPMPLEIRDWISKHNMLLVVENKQVQGLYSKACGQFCLYYASRRLCGVSVNQIYNTFKHDLQRNDEVVIGYVNSFL